MTGTVTLLATNDLHGALTFEMAERLGDMTSRHAPALLLDAGDAVACGNVTYHRRGEVVHHLMDLAGYDAGALGNREFHFRPRPQAYKLQSAEFPILCANLVHPPRYGGVRSEAWFEPLAGFRVRVFGLLVPMVTERMLARWISPARFDDPVAAARRLLGEGEAELTVCLSHLGVRRDRELAEAGLGIDLILGGHSHTALDPPERVGDTLICQNQPYGATVTRVTVRVESGRVVEKTAEVLSLKGGGGAV